MKIKLFVAREIQYFELGIFSFNSYICYLARGFIALTHDFNLQTRTFNPQIRSLNLPTCAFNLPAPAFNLATCAFSLATRAFSLLTRGFQLVTCGSELVTRGFELVTREFELLTPNSCFTFPLFSNANKAIARELLAILVSRILSKIFSWLVQLKDLAKVIFATKKNFFVHSKLFTQNFASKKT